MKKLLFLITALLSFNSYSADFSVTGYGVFSDLYEDKYAVSIDLQGSGDSGFQGSTIFIEEGFLVKAGVFKKIGSFQVNGGLIAGRENQYVVFSDGESSGASPNSNSMNAYIGFEYSYLTVSYVISEKRYEGEDVHCIGVKPNVTCSTVEAINDQIESSSVWIGLKIPF